MSALQRFQRELDGLQGQYDLLSEKIARLRQARAIETDPASQFKQDMQLKQAEAERAELLTKIEALEAKIEARQSPRVEATLPPEDEQFLQQQLAAHQRNRRRLLEQQSIYAAGETPLHLLNQIEAEEKAIQEIMQQLGR